MILFLDEALNIISFPIEDFTSLTWEESWTEPGSWSITLHPQEYDTLKDAAYIYYDGCGWGIVESVEHTRDSFKMGGRELSAVMDNYVVTSAADLSGRLESCVRTLVSTYSNVSLGTDNNYDTTVAAKIGRGSLQDILYGVLIPRGMSYKVSIDTGISQRTVKGVAHRGLSATYPENTIPAFEAAAANGFSYIETDVAFTSDGVAVCLHDATIDRTSDGTGNITQMTYSQALTYDFGYPDKYGTQFEDTPIPTFEEMLDCCITKGLNAYIELKTNRGYTESRVQELVDIVDLKGMTKNVTWISFSDTYLEWVKNYKKTARLGLLCNTTTQSVADTVRALRLKTNDTFILSSTWTDEDAQIAKDNNLPLEVCVIDAEATMKATDPYITGILSNALSAETVFASTGVKKLVFDVIRGENRTSYQSTNKINNITRQSSAEYVVLGQDVAAGSAQRTRLHAGSYRFHVVSDVGVRLGARCKSTNSSSYWTSSYSTDSYVDFDLRHDDQFAFWVYRASADGGVLTSDITSFEIIATGNPWAILSESKGNIVGAKYTRNSRDYKNYVVINVGDSDTPDIQEYDFRDVL